MWSNRGVDVRLSMPNVREERTGWRDERLSRRHRRWGWDCPAVDVDFLMLEYDRGKAVALVEYKHERAEKQFATHPSYQAMIDLGDRGQIPVFACRYSDDFSNWRVVSLNGLAKRWVAASADMTEREWVTLLYAIRGRAPESSLWESLQVEI